MGGRRRQRHHPGGIPVEEAPLWILALLAAVLWLIAWPAVVGLLAGFGRWHGERLYPALAAVVIAVGVVAGVATRKPWKRVAGPSLHDPRPLFVRFSTWLITALLLPNVLFGTLLLARPATDLTYAGMVRLGLFISLLHAGAAAVERWRRRPRA